MEILENAKSSPANCNPMKEKNNFSANHSGESDEDFPLKIHDKKSFELKSFLCNKHEFEGIEDAIKVRRIFRRMINMDVFTSVFSLVGLICAICGYELEFDGLDNLKVYGLLGLMLITSILAIIFNYLMHVENLNLQKSKNKLSENLTVLSSGEIRSVIIQTIFLLLQPYPFFVGLKVAAFNEYYHVDFYYHVNDFLYILMLIRLFFFVRLILNLSPYRSPRAQRLCSLYGTDNSYVYAVKCVMRDYPSTVTLFILLFSIFYFGYALRIAERPLNRYPPEIVPMDYNFYFNGVWCVLITLCTVGYGDYYARTDLGRSVIFVVCLWGVYVVSLVVVALNNFLTMTKGEEQAKLCHERLDLRGQLRDEAASAIRNAILLNINNNRNDESQDSDLNNELAHEIDQNLINVKTLNKKIESYTIENQLSKDIFANSQIIRTELKELDKGQNDRLAMIEKRQQNIEAALQQICEKLGLPGIPK